MGKILAILNSNVGRVNKQQAAPIKLPHAPCVLISLLPLLTNLLVYLIT